MFVTDIGMFCHTHNDDWRERLSEAPYYLKIKEDGDYVMFSYDQIRTDFSYNISREARGIIFRNGDWETPVCWAFNKFGNHAEFYAPDIDWSTAFVSEKVDGSLIKCFYDDGAWRIATNGCIDAFKAEIHNVNMPNFGEYFLTTLNKHIHHRIYRNIFDDFTANLDENLTYMFELVGPYNRVVVPYDEPAIYFLGARNKFTGEEFTCDALTMEQLGVAPFQSPKVYSLSSLDDCVKAAELKSWDDEGFVVCDANFNRVKIKSPAYVMAHYARNNNVITMNHLIDIILRNEQEEFLCYAADYKETLEHCNQLMKSYLYISNQLVKVSRKARRMPRNEYAEMVKEFPKIFRGLLFLNYDRDVTAEEYTSQWTTYKWENYLDEMENLKDEYFFTFGTNTAC